MSNLVVNLNAVDHTGVTFRGVLDAHRNADLDARAHLFFGESLSRFCDVTDFP